MEANFKPIPKESITGLVFPKQDVLMSEAEKYQRQRDLERALALGNLEHVKVKIYFADDKEHLYVDTTIWAVTGERIVLKHGFTIPNERIYKVE